MLRTALASAARLGAAARAVPAARRCLATAASLEPYHGPKAWTRDTLDPASVFIEYPEDAATELVRQAQELARTNPNPDNIVVDKSRFPNLEGFLREVEMNNLGPGGPGMVVVPALQGLDTIHEVRTAYHIYTNIMGDQLVQNAQGDKNCLVYDRDATKRMVDGQRYHQSREGGSLHTDNVNTQDTWEYMFLVCLQPARLGGESVLVSVASVFNYILEKAPEAIEVLSQDFLWENRGFADTFYAAPIFFRNKFNEPTLRFLREYMESAHERLGQRLTQKQIWALDVLSSTAELSDFQFRYNFKKGESLLCNDMHLLHGRTSFIDAKTATQNYTLEDPVNRLMQRTWIRTHNPEMRGSNQSHYRIVEASEFEAAA